MILKKLKNLSLSKYLGEKKNERFLENKKIDLENKLTNLPLGPKLATWNDCKLAGFSDEKLVNTIQLRRKKTTYRNRRKEE